MIVTQQKFIKVIRYSFDAFKPQKQTYHLNDVDSLLFRFEEIIQDPYYERNLIYKHIMIERYEKLKPFYEENYEDFKEGIWVFIDGYKNNQSLNHLKVPTPCFSAELPDDIEVYDVNWEKKMLLSDIEATYFGCYVPKRSLKDIKNIKRVKRKNE